MMTTTIKPNRFALLALAPAVFCVGLASQPNPAHAQDAEAVPVDPFSQPEQYQALDINFVWESDNKIPTTLELRTPILWVTRAMCRGQGRFTCLYVPPSPPQVMKPHQWGSRRRRPPHCSGGSERPPLQQHG